MDICTDDMKTFDALLAEVFHVSAADVRDDMSSVTIPEWDSMNYLIFISRLEENFGLSFTMDEVMNVQTIGDIRRIVETRRTQ